MSALSARMETLLQHFKCTKADLARIAGVATPSVSGWFSNETVSLKAVPAARLIAHFDLNPLWLTEGKGAMLRSDYGKIHTPLKLVVEEPNKDIESLIDGYRHASMKDRELMLIIARRATQDFERRSEKK